MSNTSPPEFGRLRSLLWPIHRSELKKFIPMLLIYALIVFNYSMLRLTKDTLVMTAKASGAAAIPFIKFWALLPMALALTFIFTRLSNKFRREQLFYIMMSIFVGFFALFAFVLYPLRDYVHPHATADWLQSHLPIGAQGFIAIFRNWSFTLFYVMSELWGTTIMTVLFWGFANEVTSVSDAKRYYAILGVGANLATVLAGKAVIFLSDNIINFPFYAHDRWGQCLSLISSVVVGSGLLSILLFRWVNRTCFASEDPKPEKGAVHVPKFRMGMRKNFAYLAKSKYLICIAIIVIAYNISLNMVEVIWKDQLVQRFPVPSELNAFNGQVLICIGILSTLLSFFVGIVIRQFGWMVSAMVTPAILFITGALFFLSHFFKDGASLADVSSFLGTTPLTLVVLLGAMQNILSRSCKFTFFDNSKEIAFIPLSPESKLKGKAAIDGVASRLGKSGSGVIHQSLILLFGGVAMSTPVVGILLCAFFFAWMVAVRSLGRQFEGLSKETEELHPVNEVKAQEPILTPQQEEPTIIRV